MELDVSIPYCTQKRGATDHEKGIISKKKRKGNGKVKRKGKKKAVEKG